MKISGSDPHSETQPQAQEAQAILNALTRASNALSALKDAHFAMEHEWGQFKHEKTFT